MKLVFAGDFCSHYTREDITPARSKEILAAVQPVLQAADARIVNLENAVGAPDCGKKIIKSGSNLLGVPENLSFLREGNFDCAVLANNHVGDYHFEGVRSTIRLLQEQGYGYVGAGENMADAYRPWHFKKDGLRVSLIAVCENEFGMATLETPGTAGYDLSRLQQVIAAEKQENDFVLVEFHGGSEYDPVPSPYVVKRYHEILDSGADALIGMHTHCMQGTEIYKGKPLIYSTGNFWFPEKEYTEEDCIGHGWFYGYLVTLSLQKGEPITFMLHPYRMLPKKLELFAGEEKEKVLAYLRMISEPLSDEKELLRLYKGWARISGVSYVQHMVYTPAYERDTTDEQKMLLARVRNLFWCESHRELMKTMLQMELDDEFDDYKDAEAQLRAWQKMPV